VHLKSQHKLSAVLEMVLDEGKNREIRRMLAQLGHKVHQLKRVGVGKMTLGGLLPGQHRQLSWSEVEALRKDAISHVGSQPAARGQGRPGGGRPRPGDRQGSRRPGPPRAFGRGTAREAAPGGRPPTGRPPAGTPRRPRKPGKASAWRKQRGK
jgi:23S rRNA pseudouridine2605 synthase